MIEKNIILIRAVKMLIVNEDSTTVRNEAIVGHQVGESTEPPIEEQNEEEEFEGNMGIKFDLISLYKSYYLDRL